MLATQSLAAIVFFVTLFTAPISAQAAGNLTLTKSTTRTTLSCQTIMASTQPLGNISTVTNTISSNATFNLRHTSTPSIISIPATVTSINTKTAHVVSTLTQGNNSFSTTTKTAVRTYINFVPGITNYTTVTSTTTTTLSTLTSTLRTSSGFRDIKASKQTCKPVAPPAAVARRDDGGAPDAGEDDTDTLISPSSAPTAGLIRINAAMFPAAVTCMATVVASTGYTTVVPANITTTRIGRTPTAFVDTTTTLTNTHTHVLRNVTRVFTQTTTSTAMLTQTIRPITSTSYTTSTLTLSTATSTFLGACRTQRLLGPTIAANASFPRAERGLTVDDIFYNQNTLRLWTSYTKTSYDCCASCHDTDDCAFGGWDTITEICYLQRQISEQCPSQNLTQGVYVMANRTTTTVPFAFEAFNGACGYLSDGGIGI